VAFEQRSLDDYIDVAQRIADFREKYPEGTLRPWNPAEPWRFVQAMGYEKDGTEVMQSFIVVVAAAYRYANDDDPGVGMAWEIFPGRTPYTRGSELQNAETSAWGRAIVAVGASDSKRGIASREEVRNRQAERDEITPHCSCGHPKTHHIYDVDLPGCNQCNCELVWNKDGSLSRSRISDEQKAAAGVMTDAAQRAHNKVERDTLAGSGPVERLDTAVDDRWTTDAPSWLVGVDPPEDQPGSILPAQRSQIMAVYTALGFKDRDKRMIDVNTVLNDDMLKRGAVFESVNDLSHRQAAALRENLHERHTGKMTRR
jgi:hypothetical protein